MRAHHPGCSCLVCKTREQVARLEAARPVQFLWLSLRPELLLGETVRYEITEAGRAALAVIVEQEGD